MTTEFYILTLCVMLIYIVPFYPSSLDQTGLFTWPSRMDLTGKSASGNCCLLHFLRNIWQKSDYNFFLVICLCYHTTTYSELKAFWTRDIVIIFISAQSFASDLTWLKVGVFNVHFRKHGGDCERYCSAWRSFSKIWANLLSLFHTNKHFRT